MATVVGLFALLLLVQFLCAPLVYWNARRRNLDEPIVYAYGVSIPIAGYFVLFGYLSKRGDLPVAEPPTEPEQEDPARTVIRTEIRQTGSTWERLVWTFYGEMERFWLVGCLLVANGLLLGAVVFDARIGAFYYGWVGAFVLLLLVVYRQYPVESVILDRRADTIKIQYRGQMKNRTLERSKATVATARQVGRLVIVAVDTNKPFISYELAVPRDRFDLLKEQFAEWNVSINGGVAETARPLQISWWRSFARVWSCLLSIIIIPLLVYAIEPALFEPTTPVLLVAVVAVAITIGELWKLVKRIGRSVQSSK